MSKRRTIAMFSLSLLDLLFCAFGGVIVLAVTFSAVIKQKKAPISTKAVFINSKIMLDTTSVPPNRVAEFRNILERAVTLNFTDKQNQNIPFETFSIDTISTTDYRTGSANLYLTTTIGDIDTVGISVINSYSERLVSAIPNNARLHIWTTVFFSGYKPIIYESKPFPKDTLSPSIILKKIIIDVSSSPPKPRYHE